MNIDYKPSDI